MTLLTALSMVGLAGILAGLRLSAKAREQQEADRHCAGS
jgi:hypothetical protein